MDKMLWYKKPTEDYMEGLPLGNGRLAAMALAKGARALHPSGMRYTQENITGLLSMRHATRKARRAGERLRGPRARTREMDDAFERAFSQLLDEKG